MSKLAQAGDSSTASPACACSVATFTAVCMLSACSSGTPVACSAASISGASRPISTTARQQRCTADAKGAKSWPLPSPPRITTSWRSAPRPLRAASVAPTLVPLLSSKYSTCSTMPTGSTRCGSPRYSRRPYSMGASGAPVCSARASAASALLALWRPRMRSASAGIRRWIYSSSSTVARARLPLSVSSCSPARTSQTMPLTSSRPKSPGREGMPKPKLIQSRWNSPLAAL